MQAHKFWALGACVCMFMCLATGFGWFKVED